MSVISSNKKIFSSMLWVSIEKFGYSGLYFISTIILARLLTPQDYGLIGLLTIFISVSQMIVESGLGGALVKKLNPTHEDYSTIFTFNLAGSCLLYLVLFFVSPYIADYYNKPILSDIIKVLALTIIINSFTLVQRVHLLKELKFRRQSVISISSLLISLIISVGLAYFNYGVWALVFQQVTYAFFYSVFTYLTVRFTPSFLFSKSSFKDLFGFGSRLFISSIIQIVYNDIFSMIIGKIYNVATTGLYYQAKKLVDFPLSIFRALIDGAAFPILAKIDDEKEFAFMSSKISRGIITISFPLLLGIPLFSKSIVLIVLGNKWLGSAEILSILSFGSIGLILEANSRNIIKSSGRADLLLKSEILKKGIGFFILFITLHLSLSWLLWGVVISNTFSFIINIIIVSRITLYSIKKQIYDLMMPLMISVFAGGVIYFIGTSFHLSLILDFLMKFTLLLIMYVSIGFMLKIKEFNILNYLKK